MRKPILTVFLAPAGALLLGGCGGESPRTAAPAKAVEVAVMTAQYENVPAVIEAPGSIQAVNRIVLSSQINGYVRSVPVRAGEMVRAGQVLATLDSRDADSQKEMSEASVQEANAALDEARKGAEAAQSMLKAAQASHDLAQATYGRYQKLAESRSASPQELDEVRSRRDAAAADLAARQTMAGAAEDRVRQVQARIGQASAQSRRADVALSWTVVKAPSAGRVVETPVDPGTAIFPGTPLLTLESTGAAQVVANLPTAQAGRLTRGLEVTVLSGEDSVSGKISEVIPVSTMGSHTVQFKVDLPRSFAALSGDFVRVLVPAGTRGALLVPHSALRRTGQLTGLFVVDSASKARLRLVKSSPYDADRLEILSGVDQGERVVVSPGQQVTDGTPLEVRS